MRSNIISLVVANIFFVKIFKSIYYREGQVPGNPPSRPKVVAHMMVNGGSDSASVLEKAVSQDGSLGDGLKVFRDSFNAY